VHDLTVANVHVNDGVARPPTLEHCQGSGDDPRRPHEADRWVRANVLRATSAGNSVTNAPVRQSI
jgi:hypothetical protein